MDVLSLIEDNGRGCAARAANVLRTGGVILYPTDTLYGLGADALSDVAVEKVYSIKGREEGKPMHAIVADLEMAGRYGEIDDRVRLLAQKFPKGKITFVVKKKAGANTGIVRDGNTFGFRIPDNEFCIAMLRAFDGPITATSANKSGEAPESSVEKILEQLGASAEGIALAIDGGAISGGLASSVVDLSAGEVRILREGAIPAVEIKKALEH